MIMANIVYSLGLLLFGFLYEVTGLNYCGPLWCKDGYHCCNYNTSCCRNVNQGAVAGIAIGVFVVVGTCIVVCIICMRRRRSQPGTVVVQNQPAPGVIVATNTVPAFQMTGQTGYIQQPASYGQPAPYGQSASYGQPAPYGQSASYCQPAPYGQPTPYGLQVSNAQPMNELNKYAMAPPPYTHWSI